MLQLLVVSHLALAGGRYNSSPLLTKEKIVGPRAHETTTVADLPSDFFWGNVNGTNYLTETRNQHIPQYCGACWAFGTLSSLSDRLKIARKAAYPEIILAPQVLINCGGGGSCDGGNVGGVFDFLEQYGIPDETCQNYEATNSFQKECSQRKLDDGTPQLGVCETCAPGKNCTAVEKFQKWGLSEYGYVLGGDDVDASGARLGSADKLKAELFANGPLACGIHANAKLEAFGMTESMDDYPDQIFHDVALAPSNHILSIVGWGTATSGEYWVVRNSWGSFFADNGFFKIKMHSENLGIEESCSYAMPGPFKPSGEEEVAGAKPSVPKGSFFDYSRPSVVSNQPREHVLSPRPDPSQAPSSYDVRDVGGRNFATINRNQHIPQYCGSCWAHATASALSDRFALARASPDSGSIHFAEGGPEIDLSPQVIVNCVTNNSKGCNGGDPASVYPFIHDHGVTDETCQPYQAENKDCSAESICVNCDPDKGCYAMGKAAPWQKKTSGAVNNFTKYYVEEYGTVTGAANMAAEIAARGPIACSICVTEELENYSGGIFKDTSGCKRSDHSIAVGGYGVDGDTGYWIVRNSWGTYWGENGWFRLAKGVDNLGIESLGCQWATPKL